MEGEGEQAGGHHQDQGPGDLEERPEVQPDPAPVQEVPQDEGGPQPEHRAHRLPHGAARPLGRGLGRGEQEEGGLHTLPEDDDERQARQREPAAEQGGVHPLLELALDPGGLPPHPEDHPGEDADGGERHEPLEDLLGLPLQLAGHGEDDAADDEAHADRGRRPPPHELRAVGPAELPEVREEDRDDQRGLDALPERDQEGGSHRRAPLSQVCLTVSVRGAEILLWK